jgi:hypothetical protein
MPSPGPGHRSSVNRILRGAAAGAAGTTALNMVTYLDMALRGRAASQTPERTVEKIADLLGLGIPGTGATRDNRLSGWGALSGLAAGVAVGMAYGACHAVLGRPGPLGGPLLATGGALLVGNGPMTALGLTDPRSWTPADWASDLAPHLAYGWVTAATYAATG